MMTMLLLFMAMAVSSLEFGSHRFQGHETKFATTAGSSETPVVFVHGFGGCAEQWRAALEPGDFAIDLLGFGGSDKADVDYSIELWADQVLEFVDAKVPGKCFLVGNSIGSIVCLAAARKKPAALKGVALFNVAVGTNSKALPLSFREFLEWPAPILALPIFALLDVLLASPLARPIFDKIRNTETVRNVLLKAVYKNAERVDDDLVRMITAPAEDPGALGVFAKIFAGDPGDRPERIVDGIPADFPIAVFWGDEDVITPLAGPVAKFFRNLPTQRESAEFTILPGLGHCPFDDRPDTSLPPLRSWLREQQEQNSAVEQEATVV